MKYQEKIEEIRKIGETFGAIEGENCYFRNNTKKDAFDKGGAYFGYVEYEEGPSGPYHDFSYVVFPDIDESKPWLVCLGVGSSGFKNDYDLASQPGLRRLFLNLISKDGFIKSDFLDIETSLTKEFMNQSDNLKKNITKNYEKLLPVCEIILDPYSEEGHNKLISFLALYADIRNWGRNKTIRSAIKNSIELGRIKNEVVEDFSEVKNLLGVRKYVVLQGAPGTGKTRLAKKIAEEEKAKIFFTQFHAETSYSDFIWGIRPDLENTDLSYKKLEGPFVKAIKYAIENKSEKVVLIIDEINRANLANILGPIFYLFEYRLDINDDVLIDITDDLKISKLPENFYTIATMNTADRSLAVVDYALRRRFAWYTLIPKHITDSSFFKEDFEDMENIFQRYATDEELNLQPGQGYYLADSKEEMDQRLKYEIMPLIKEYLSNGMLLQATDAFTNYFYSRIDEVMFK